MAFPPPTPPGQPQWSTQPSTNPLPELRPHTLWYWFGGTLALVGTLIGLIAGIALLFGLNTVPESEARFADGDSHTFQVTEEQTAELGWELYLRNTPELSWQDYPVDERCAITSHGDGADPVLVLESSWQTYDAATDEDWQVVALFTTERPGEYTITCDQGLDATYGILYDDPFGVLGRGVLSIVLLLGLPLLSVGAGVTTIIITRIRRRNHQRRLWAAYGPSGDWR